VLGAGCWVLGAAPFVALSPKLGLRPSAQIPPEAANLDPTRNHLLPRGPTNICG